MCAGVVANAMPSDIVAMQVTELLSKIARQSVEQSAVPLARKRSRLEGVRIQPAKDKTAVLYVVLAVPGADPSSQRRHVACFRRTRCSHVHVHVRPPTPHPIFLIQPLVCVWCM